MNRNFDILNELSGISPLVAGIPNTNVFKVPDSYFDLLPGQLLQVTGEDVVPDFSKAVKHPFSVPEGYFDSLPGAVLTKLKAQHLENSADEILELSPLLASIGNKNVFSVPNGYFRQLDLSVVTSESAAKIVQMPKRTGMFRYMAAAVVAGIIGLTVINLPVNTGSTGSTAPATDIAAAGKPSQKADVDDFDAQLNTVSDQEIEAYLKASGKDINAALVASASDDNNLNLPGAEDYLINDNTLNEFLTKINLNN